MDKGPARGREKKGLACDYRVVVCGINLVRAVCGAHTVIGEAMKIAFTRASWRGMIRREVNLTENKDGYVSKKAKKEFEKVLKDFDGYRVRVQVMEE